MRLKKLLVLSLAAVMGLSLVACGSKSDDSGKEKTYKIASDTTFAPFEFENKDGERVGIDLELLEAIADEEGFKYEIDAVGFDAAMASVENGQSDGMIAGMSITDERKEKYDFSDSYYTSKVCFATEKGSDIEKLDDLKGKNVVAKVGTVGASYAEEMSKKYDFEVKQVESSAMMYQEVTSGNAVACFEDYPVMNYEITENGQKLEVPFISDEGSEYGFAVLKGENSELIDMFNSGLKKIKDNGKYQEIVDKYAKEK
ncbi:MAG TPA: transporter substrate-binding domain-containing protein [Candidatus Anaerostipes excrementavium]|uniref:Transporter substrate-binding domain-containing protein n=1 Tax=Candidatus Anaerostipes excrementavium TaxID=2838463 RepID=A0A9D1WUJ7_9FIRM|nr:transporter substrate-binding domain-containing protein [uncultured Anaerostipes sp.]HIX67081.1 transporter substrate-binding domain-containing protein [Candidatus Anaerostipes excrementavium]